MKKICVLAVFTVLFTNAVFAAEFSMSAGAGAFLGGIFTRYQMDATGTQYDAGQIKNVPITLTAVDEGHQLNFGGFLFFDASWVEFAVSIQGGTYTWARASDMRSDATILDRPTVIGTGTEMMLGFTLLGKYPFSLNEQFTVYPLLGVEYQLALLEYRQEFAHDTYNRTDGFQERDKNGSAYRLDTWNSLFIDIGGGVDFSFHSPLYLRTELVYAFRLPTPYEMDQLEIAKSNIDNADVKLAGLTSGPTLKIGLGWRFY